MNQTIDRLPVSQLPDRYNKARSVVYERLKDLGIEPERQGNKAYLNADQIELLDRLHQHIESGGSTADFLDAIGLSDRRTGQNTLAPQYHAFITDPPYGVSDEPIGQYDGHTDLSVVLQVFEVFAQRLNLTPDPLLPQRQLQELADRGWTASTSQLQAILGSKPREGQRFGFELKRVGRSGREVAWVVRGGDR